MKLNKKIINIKTEKEKLRKEFEEVKTRVIALENAYKQELAKLQELMAQYKYLENLEKVGNKDKTK